MSEAERTINKLLEQEPGDIDWGEPPSVEFIQEVKHWIEVAFQGDIGDDVVSERWKVFTGVVQLLGTRMKVDVPNWVFDPERGMNTWWWRFVEDDLGLSYPEY